MAGQHRNEFFKYRKSGRRNTLDGSVPCVSYNRFRSNPTHPLSFGNKRLAGYQHNFYMHGSPREYRPNINAPSVNWDKYESYEPFLRPNNLNLDASELHNPIDRHIFQHEQNENSDIHPDMLDTVPNDFVKRFLELTDALGCLQESLPKDHPDIINLTNAISDIINDPQAISQIKALAGDNKPSKLGFDNPYKTDVFMQPENEYDRHAELFDEGIRQFSLNTDMAVNDTAEPDVFNQTQTLDEIVINEIGELNVEPQADIMHDQTGVMQSNETVMQEIDNAMDEITHPIEELQQAQEDIFFKAQQIFDQQMQSMNNPFMM